MFHTELVGAFLRTKCHMPVILLLIVGKAKDECRFRVLTKVAYFSKLKFSDPTFSGDGIILTPVYMVAMLRILMIGY
jgi:hypothetical protein